MKGSEPMKRIIFLPLAASFFFLPALSCSTKQVIHTPPVQIKQETHAKRYDSPEINEVIAGAWNSYSSARYEQSALDFERLIAKRYVHYDILFGAGCANMKYYDLRKALAFFDRCLKDRKDHYEALFFRADIYRQMKDYAKARADLEAILAIPSVSFLICGLYPGEMAGNSELAKRKTEASAILKMM